MSYGTDVADMFHQVGVYAGRILNGTNPAELPMVQSTKFELVIQYADRKGNRHGRGTGNPRNRRRGDRMRRRQPKLARSAGASPAQVRS
jgi:hypothetical protein